MKLKFVDGSEINCLKLVEQKVFIGDGATGWLCTLSAVGAMSSEGIDALFAADNISELLLTDDTTDTSVCIKGYSKVTSAVAKYTDGENKILEVQMTKGV